jgi:hypothetical protein
VAVSAGIKRDHHSITKSASPHIRVQHPQHRMGIEEPAGHCGRVHRPLKDLAISSLIAGLSKFAPILSFLPFRPPILLFP